MWPAGVPSSIATQRILFWQFQTMQMMYATIYKALEEAGLENQYEPQDYLNFFCLGNRELPDSESIPNPIKPTGQNAPQVFCFTQFLFFCLLIELVYYHYCFFRISEHRYKLKRIEDS